MTKVVRFCLPLALAIVYFFVVQAHREHKVHNIVLYPDKHSWCKTTTIKQVISYPGCTPVEIDNNVCVGACFSYSIPHTEPSNPGEMIVPYCDSCQPSKTQWHQITLQCNRNDDTPSQLIKHVQIIKNCSCTSCKKDSLMLAKYPGSSEEQLSQQNVDSEFLDALQKHNESSSAISLNKDHLGNMNLISNQKLIDLLTDVQANTPDQDKKHIIELLNITQESLQYKLTFKSIIDLLDILHDNATDMNVEDLPELKLKFEYLNHYNKENFQERDKSSERKKLGNLREDTIGNDRQVDNVHVKRDPSTAIPVALWIKSPHDSNTKMNESSVLALASEQWLNSTHNNEEEGIDINMNKDKNNHFSEMVDGFQQPLVNSNEQHSSEHSANNDPHYHQHQHQQHQHHLNENIISHGHLTRGPHGALVIEPNRIHEKFDVNIHELKPNHAGTLLSYHSHSDERKIDT